jgi:hypothetical protein
MDIDVRPRFNGWQVFSVAIRQLEADNSLGLDGTINNANGQQLGVVHRHFRY